MSPPLLTAFTTQRTPPGATSVSSFAQPPPGPALNSTKPLSAMSPLVAPSRSEDRPRLLSSSPVTLRITALSCGTICTVFMHSSCTNRDFTVHSPDIHHREDTIFD